MAGADPNARWQEIARHDVVMATVRAFTERAGALRVAVLLDRGEDVDCPLLECEAGRALTVSQGDERFLVPDEALHGVPPLPLAPLKPLPATAIDVDAPEGRIAAPLGAVEALAAAVTELARVLGGRTVAMADFATRSGEELSIAARVGEPVVVAVGEQQFELPGDG